MNKFEEFLKKVLSILFKEMPYNSQKADNSLVKIVKSQELVEEDKYE